MDSGRLKSQQERDFQAAVRRASERHKERRRSLEKMERKAQESPDNALAAALILEANARAGRRVGRRCLRSRWGVKVYSRRPDVAYAVVWPEPFAEGQPGEVAACRGHCGARWLGGGVDGAA